MNPTDGAYDEPTEAAQEPIVFDTAGTFPVCARATDGGGSTSGPSCVDVEVEAPEPTVRLRAIEVNQVIQNWKNEIPLYQNKDTVARLFFEKIDPQAANWANGLLHGTRNGQPLPDSPLSTSVRATAGDDATAFMLIDDDDADTVADDDIVSYRAGLVNSLDFLLPADWIDQGGAVELEFELTVPIDGVLECAEPDGNPDCNVSVTFEPSAVPLMDFYAFPYNRNHVFELEVDALAGVYVLSSGGRDSDPIAFDATRETVRSAAADVFDLDEDRVDVSCRGCGGSAIRTYTLTVMRGDEESLLVDDGSLAGNATVTTAQTGGSTIVPTQKQMREQVRRVTDVFPIDRIDYRYRDIGGYFLVPTLEETNERMYQIALLDSIMDSLGSSHEGLTRFGYMLDTGPVSAGGGLARSDWGVSSSYAQGTEALTASGYARNRGGHEAAHVYGRPHAVTGPRFDPPQPGAVGTIGICGAKAKLAAEFHPFTEDTGLDNLGAENPADSTTWPTIGTLSDGFDAEIWGSSPRAVADGFEFRHLAVIDPRSSAALMSYCSPRRPAQSRWVSSYAYGKLRESLGSGNGTEAREPTGGGIGDYVIVFGSMDPETEEVSLDPIVTVNGIDPGFQPGDVHVAILDGVGAEIASQDVLLVEDDINADDFDGPGTEQAPSAFVATIPLPGGSSPVAVVVEIDSQEVARIDASANPPTVQIDSPTLATVASETIPLAWMAADLDGDPLRASVLLSLDGGTSWETLLTDSEESAYDFPVRYLEGSIEARVRVLVTDGFHTTEALSDLFELDAGYPIADIDIPVNGMAVPADGLLHLRGSGWDPEDGVLDGPALTWTGAASPPPGDPLPGELILGAGAALDIPASQLPTGCQIVTLTATDSDSRPATDSVEVDIGETGCLGLFFADGFETGDFSVWSGVVP